MSQWERMKRGTLFKAFVVFFVWSWQFVAGYLVTPGHRLMLGDRGAQGRTDCQVSATIIRGGPLRQSGCHFCFVLFLGRIWNVPCSSFERVERTGETGGRYGCARMHCGWVSIRREPNQFLRRHAGTTAKGSLGVRDRAFTKYIIAFSSLSNAPERKMDNRSAHTIFHGQGKSQKPIENSSKQCTHS